MTEPRRRASAVVVDTGRMLVLRAKDPVDGTPYLFVPGGEIEAGEAPSQAAARETLEETGYRVNVDADSGFELRYDFVWAGGTVPCSTWFFRAHLVPAEQSPPPVQDADFILGVEWLPLERFEQAFSYHREIREALRRFL